MNRFLYFSILFFLTFLISSCSDDEMPEMEMEMENPITNFEGRLPQVIFQTNGNTIVDEPKIPAELRIVDGTEVLYNGHAGIEFRGASSQALFPKKSYGVEFWDADNNDIDASVFDMPEEEDWVLHGPYSDKSLIRNKLIYDISRDIGMYASRAEFVELTINDNARGVYVFMEKLKRDNGRIDLNQLRPEENEGEDVTGGYILKIDKTAGGNLGSGYNSSNSFISNYAPPSATSGQNIFFLYDYPDAEDITVQQKEYISSYIRDFEDALASEDFDDPVNGYEAYIDVESFIDFFILNEVSNNVDAYRLSTYMHKDKNEKLRMGPIWDFNLAFGNADYCLGGRTDVWSFQFNSRCSDDFWLAPFWWERLMEDERFTNRLKERWNMLRANELSNTALMSRIDDYLALLEDTEAIDTNFDIWRIIGDYIWPNNFVGASYDEEIDYLRNWLTDRLSWMDGAIANL